MTALSPLAIHPLPSGDVQIGAMSLPALLTFDASEGEG